MYLLVKFVKPKKKGTFQYTVFNIVCIIISLEFIYFEAYIESQLCSIKIWIYSTTIFKLSIYFLQLGTLVGTLGAGTI